MMKLLSSAFFATFMLSAPALAQTNFTTQYDYAPVEDQAWKVLNFRFGAGKIDDDSVKILPRPSKFNLHKQDVRAYILRKDTSPKEFALKEKTNSSDALVASYALQIAKAGASNQTSAQGSSFTKTVTYSQLQRFKPKPLPKTHDTTIPAANTFMVAQKSVATSDSIIGVLP